MTWTNPQIGQSFLIDLKKKKKNNQVTEDDIVGLVAAELPYRSRLRAGVEFIDHLPKTATRKIARLKLRELARSMHSI